MICAECGFCMGGDREGVLRALQGAPTPRKVNSEIRRTRWQQPVARSVAAAGVATRPASNRAPSWRPRRARSAAARQIEQRRACEFSPSTRRIPPGACHNRELYDSNLPY